MVARSRIGKFLNSEKSQRVMPGASKIPRPALPGRFAPTGTSANAEVLNHLLIVRMSTPAFGSPTRSGRTPAVDVALFALPSPPGSFPKAEVTVRGRPLSKVKMPESSQPPSAYFNGLVDSVRNGKGYTYEIVRICRRSKVARPYSACQLYVFCGAFERSLPLSVRFFDHVYANPMSPVLVNLLVKLVCKE